MLAHSLIFPTFLEGPWNGGGKERSILWKSVSEDAGGEKSQKCTSTHFLCLLSSLPTRLSSADADIDLAHSFMNAGSESLCLQVSFIKPLERDTCLEHGSLHCSQGQP